MNPSPFPITPVHAPNPYSRIYEVDDDENVSFHPLRGERRRQRKGMVEKRSWSNAEDEFLRQLVTTFGGPSLTLSWTQIASEFSNQHSDRSGKQCRERYANHLHPDVRKGGWTKEEDLTIRRLQRELGNQWAKMVRYLPGRSDNSIKNRFWSFQRSKERKRERVMAATAKSPTPLPAAERRIEVERRLEVEVSEQRRYKDQLDTPPGPYKYTKMKDKYNTHLGGNFQEVSHLGFVPSGDYPGSDYPGVPLTNTSFPPPPDHPVPHLKRRRVSDDSEPTTALPLGPFATPYAKPFAPSVRAFMQGMQPAVEPIIYEVERSPQARYATLAKMVSMDYDDSEDGEEDIGGGEFEESSPAPKGYGHLPLGPTVSETHSPVSSPSTTTHTTSGGSASTSTSQLEIGLGLGLVAPAISGVRYITDEELAKSRIIFNWPMTQDNKPFSVGNGAS